jgi:hypothetical protein
MEADRFSVRVREHDGTYLGAIFGDRDTLMDEPVPSPRDAIYRLRNYRPVRSDAPWADPPEPASRAELIAAALASHDARVTA